MTAPVITGLVLLCLYGIVFLVHRYVLIKHHLQAMSVLNNGFLDLLTIEMVVLENNLNKQPNNTIDSMTYGFEAAVNAIRGPNNKIWDEYYKYPRIATHYFDFTVWTWNQVYPGLTEAVIKIVDKHIARRAIEEQRSKQDIKVAA